MWTQQYKGSEGWKVKAFDQHAYRAQDIGGFPISLNAERRLLCSSFDNSEVINAVSLKSLQEYNYQIYRQVGSDS